ncbi:hypothetical protein V6N13_001219 [Hibiscus sabdariffa]|uniref:Uncharacterized protein n=1 Tax=Hibiscus sabdariffa TaxID=183260 RepID=A0ABR2G813_9ROSI
MRRKAEVAIRSQRGFPEGGMNPGNWNYGIRIRKQRENGLKKKAFRNVRYTYIHTYISTVNSGGKPELPLLSLWLWLSRR